MNGNGNGPAISNRTTFTTSLSYQTRQAARNAQYRREYQAWTRRLPIQERQTLKQNHLDRPLIDYHVSESVCDISERNMAETLRTGEQAYSNADAHEQVRRVLLRISDSQNPRLEVATLHFVFGFSAQMGLSGTQIAAKHGLSRAAFSKRCKEVQREFGILPSRGMKSELACRTYAQTNGAMKTQCS